MSLLVELWASFWVYCHHWSYLEGPGPGLNVKTVFPGYRDSHVKDKTGDPYTGKTSLYWDSCLGLSHCLTGIGISIIKIRQSHWGWEDKPGILTHWRLKQNGWYFADNNGRRYCFLLHSSSHFSRCRLSALLWIKWDLRIPGLNRWSISSSDSWSSLRTRTFKHIWWVRNCYFLFAFVIQCDAL